MKIKINGELQMHQLRQALFEELISLEEQHLVRHTKNITLYLTPTNGFGSPILCKDNFGKTIEEIISAGPYQSAADEYDLG